MTFYIIAGIVLAAGALVVVGFVRRFKTAQATFDTIVDLGTADDLAFDEDEHVQALAPKLTFVPDGFPCLYADCTTDATPTSVWCDKHRAVVGSYPSEPIERGQR